MRKLVAMLTAVMLLMIGCTADQSSGSSSENESNNQGDESIASMEGQHYAEQAAPPCEVWTPEPNFDFENTARVFQEVLNRSEREAEEATHTLWQSGVRGAVSAEVLENIRGPGWGNPLNIKIVCEDNMVYILNLHFFITAGFEDNHFYFIQTIYDVERGTIILYPDSDDLSEALTGR